ncbi:hypothetical protein JHK84_054776 [Glycine max]|uniref:UDP-glucose flavonoid 3-O-glucosyltransferase 7 n=1 Tax=Glycine soja TaxID=3848 RepID=A0A0B2RCX8_GLYSO|nr:hypothetical protein JHK84_054776 [Glycine max]KHN32256.1 UDP-glucose flavonoid 3-O-glucosyltransferase 7 [Glycine soja]
MEIIQAVISCHLLTRLRRKKGAVAKESESRSYGVVVNSFYELEKASIDEHECLKWRDTKKPNSVVHVCFGCTVKFKRGWVPQVLILEHEAIGVFVTHCGWNSSLEAVNAGVPMITWPMGADQIFNEKLVTEVLKIGMPIGARKLFRLEGDSITCDAVEEAVKRIMIGEEAIEMRNRTKVPSQLAKQAMKGGGSSFTELEALVEELSSLNY